MKKLHFFLTILGALALFTPTSTYAAELTHYASIEMCQAVCTAAPQNCQPFQASTGKWWECNPPSLMDSASDSGSGSSGSGSSVLGTCTPNTMVGYTCTYQSSNPVPKGCSTSVSNTYIVCPKLDLPPDGYYLNGIDVQLFDPCGTAYPAGCPASYQCVSLGSGAGLGCIPVGSTLKNGNCTGTNPTDVTQNCSCAKDSTGVSNWQCTPVVDSNPYVVSGSKCSTPKPDTSQGAAYDCIYLNGSANWVCRASSNCPGSNTSASGNNLSCVYISSSEYQCPKTAVLPGNCAATPGQSSQMTCTGATGTPDGFTCSTSWFSHTVTCTGIAKNTTSVSAPAPGKDPCGGANGNLGYCPLEPLPGLEDPANVTLPNLLNAAYKILMSLGALFAVVMLTIAGIEYMVSTVPGVKSKARGQATAALVGLLILSSVYLILYTVNPNLVKFCIFNPGNNTCDSAPQSAPTPSAASKIVDNAIGTGNLGGRTSNDPIWPAICNGQNFCPTWGSYITYDPSAFVGSSANPYINFVKNCATTHQDQTTLKNLQGHVETFTANLVGESASRTGLACVLQ